MDDLHRLHSITSSSLKLSKCTVEVELPNSNCFRNEDEDSEIEKASKGNVDEDEIEGNI